MNYLIQYNPDTGEIIERRPGDIKYPEPIADPYIVVDKADFMSTLDGTKRVNPVTKAIEEITLTLDEAKLSKKAEISTARYRAERAGMLFNGYTIATDDVSQNKIAGAVLAAVEDINYSIGEWLCADGTFISLSNAEIFALGRALRTHIQTKFTRNKELFVAIDAAESKEELQAIEWSDA